MRGRPRAWAERPATPRPAGRGTKAALPGGAPGRLLDHFAFSFASGFTGFAAAAFAGHCAAVSIQLVMMPATPTSASCDSYSRDRCAVCSTRSRCFAMVSEHFLRWSVLPSSFFKESMIFLHCTIAAMKFEKQKNLRPIWIVPVPARFPPESSFHCFMWPTWSMHRNVVSDAFWRSSRTRSMGSAILRLVGMDIMTGNSLHHRCVRRADASCVMAILALVSTVARELPALGFAMLTKPTIARAAYWKNLASLSRPSALLQRTLKSETT
mmetsp:Transcript_67497/g.198213  ORF Transcript_67497/g.198213 Transcript_67497/m.198213 type:complete len:268 (+) Transcript_67497:178-981(+)